MSGQEGQAVRRSQEVSRMCGSGRGRSNETESDFCSPTYSAVLHLQGCQMSTALLTSALAKGPSFLSLPFLMFRLLPNVDVWESMLLLNHFN